MASSWFLFFSYHNVAWSNKHQIDKENIINNPVDKNEQT